MQAEISLGFQRLASQKALNQSQSQRADHTKYRARGAATIARRAEAAGTSAGQGSTTTRAFEKKTINIQPHYSRDGTKEVANEPFREHNLLGYARENLPSGGAGSEMLHKTSSELPVGHTLHETSSGQPLGHGRPAGRLVGLAAGGTTIGATSGRLWGCVGSRWPGNLCRPLGRGHG